MIMSDVFYCHPPFLLLLMLAADVMMLNNAWSSAFSPTTLSILPSSLSTTTTCSITSSRNTRRNCSSRRGRSARDTNNKLPFTCRDIYFPTLLWTKQEQQQEEDDVDDDVTSDPAITALQHELETLQNDLTYIEALEERNKSQLDSFVDEQDQWDSMEEEERQLLQKKDVIIKRIDDLTELLIQCWMNAKSMDG